MGSTPETAPSASKIDPRWLRSVRVTALLCICSVPISFALKAFLSSGEHADQVEWSPLLLYFAVPWTLPFLHILSQVRLRGRPKKSGLALAVITGLGWGFIGLPFAAYALEGWAGLWVLVPVALGVSAIKTYYSMEKEEGDHRTLGLAFVPFAIYFAIFFMISVVALPGLLRSRIAANQDSAVRLLRTFNNAATTYSETYHNGYPPNLLALGPPSGGAKTCNAAKLIDQKRASGRWNGYVFEYQPGPRVDKLATGCVPGVRSYTLTARPVEYPRSGMNSYLADQSGVIRLTNEDRPATEKDRKLSSE